MRAPGGQDTLIGIKAKHIFLRSYLDSNRKILGQEAQPARAERNRFKLVDENWLRMKSLLVLLLATPVLLQVSPYQIG